MSTGELIPPFPKNLPFPYSGLKWCLDYYYYYYYFILHYIPEYFNLTSEKLVCGFGQSRSSPEHPYSDKTPRYSLASEHNDVAPHQRILLFKPGTCNTLSYEHNDVDLQKRISFVKQLIVYR